MTDEEQESEPGEVEGNRLEDLEERQQGCVVADVRKSGESHGKGDESKNENVRVAKAIDDLLSIPNQRNSEQRSDDVNESLRTPLVVIDDCMFNDVNGEDVSEGFLRVPNTAEYKS